MSVPSTSLVDDSSRARNIGLELCAFPSEEIGWQQKELRGSFYPFPFNKYRLLKGMLRPYKYSTMRVD
eukprot:scaffold37778_cov229-Amphora_coffeaeformis.AAC.3